MTTAATPKAGLEDTVATSSAICYLDGDRGVLPTADSTFTICARDFEEVCFPPASPPRRGASSATCKAIWLPGGPFPMVSSG
jgi:hypothetical protein